MATISQIKIGDNVYRLKDAPLTYEMSNTWMLQKVIGMHNRSAVTISSPSYGNGKWEQLCGCKFSIERTISNNSPGALSNYILPDMYVLGIGSVLWDDKDNYTGIKRVVRINFDKDVDLRDLTAGTPLYQDWTSGYGYCAPLTTNTGTTTTHQNISACCYINSTNYNYISEEQGNEKILHPRLLACQDTGHDIDVDGTCSLLVFTLGGDHLFTIDNERNDKLYFADYFWVTFDENTIGREDYNWND